MKFKEIFGIIYTKNKYYKKFDNTGFHINDDLEYYKGYLLHRKNGPAIEWDNGTKFWYKNGKKHRENGPAEIWASDDKKWYLNGIKYSEDKYWKITNVKKISILLKSFPI